MSIAASLVVRFGAGADSSALVKMEWDDKLNVDAAGKVVSNVYPGDSRFLFIHHDASKLRIGRVLATHGQIVRQTGITRARKQQLLFAEATDSHELDYIPTGSPAARWFGNTAAGLKRADRLMSITGGQLPALAELSYTIAAQGFKLITPVVEVAEGESYPITIVAWMEAA